MPRKAYALRLSVDVFGSVVGVSVRNQWELLGLPGLLRLAFFCVGPRG
jgi:hypothetical protein